VNLRTSIDQLVASALNPDRCADGGDVAGEERDSRAVEGYLERWSSKAYPDFSPFVGARGSMDQ
jgi:hypothetical protein